MYHRSITPNDGCGCGCGRVGRWDVANEQPSIPKTYTPTAIPIGLTDLKVVVENPIGLTRLEVVVLV